MLLPLWILALLSVGIGLYFTFVHPEEEFVNPGWLMPAAVGVAIAGILLAWLVYQRRTMDAASLASAFGPITESTHHAPVTSTSDACSPASMCRSIHAKSRVACDDPVTTKNSSRAKRVTVRSLSIPARAFSIAV